MSDKIEAPKTAICPEAETKARILDSALTIFGEKGYHQATMAEIAEAARVGKGTLYWHFASKEDLFAGMVEQLTQGINLKLKSVLETPDQPFPELLLAFTKECLAYSYHHREVARFFMSTSQGFSEELRKKLRKWRIEFLALNTELIRLGLETGYFRPDLELAKVVTAFTGMLFAFGERQLLEENWNEIEAEALFIKDLLIQGIANKSREDQIDEEKT